MTEPAAPVRVARAQDQPWRPSNQLGIANTDLAAALGGGPIAARLWRLAPGQASTLHRHETQTELYVLLEGAGRLRTGGTSLTLEPLSAVLVAPEELRQLFNDGAADALWLVAGVPPEHANTLEMSPAQLARLYPSGPLAQPPELGAGAPEVFVDVGSPYAWLAIERFERVVGVRPALQPVLLGGIFAATGRSSWARTDARERGMAEVERRAAAAGLPSLVWPPGWPSDYLMAMRAAVWAGHQGRRDAFIRTALRRAFTQGADLAQPAALRAVADAVGLDAAELEPAVGRPAIKAELRAYTDRALRLGVTGVPTTRVKDRLIWGDDRLDEVAAARG